MMCTWVCACVHMHRGQRPALDILFPSCSPLTFGGRNVELTGSARLAGQQAAASSHFLPPCLPGTRVQLCLASAWELGVQTGVLVSRQQAVSWFAHSCEMAAAMTSIRRCSLSPGHISGLEITSYRLPESVLSMEHDS